jgi:putative ABC transport system permease protein
MLRAFAVGWRRLVRRDVVDRELDDEMRQYLEAATEARITAGLSRADAERAARVDFGGVENVKDQLRSTGWDAVVSTVWQDVRFGLRTLRRNPAFTFVAIATIVVGIGANTAMFSVVRAVMLRPLPYAKPEQLALLWTNDPARGLHEGPTAYQTVVDWRTSSRSFTDLAVVSSTSATLADDPHERVVAAYVSANAFPLLGVAPQSGRAFTQREQDERVPVAVISHALWQRRFAGDSSVIGKTLRIDDPGKGGPPSPTIVGVMPASFSYPDKQTQYWIPATLYWRWDRERTERFPVWSRRWSDAVAAVRCRRIRAGHRVCECREPLAGSRRGSPTRAGDAAGVRRESWAPRAPVAG